MRPLAIGCALMMSIVAGPSWAEATPPAADAIEPKPIVTHHQGTFNGRRLAYDASVEELIYRGPDDKPTGSAYSISYTVRANKGADRPVVFMFNGGPGSSSAWLHIGFSGPKRVAFADEVRPRTVPPFALVDNVDSILDVADVVLIDPPGTGFGRILPGGKPEQFFSVDRDAEATVDLITRWVDRHRRWNAPKYLMGESYGTIRAAEVAKLLAGGPTQTGQLGAVTLNGVILFGQALDLDGGAGDDRRYAELLPTIAATAWYHNVIDRRNRSVAEVVGEASAFVATDYVAALFAGSSLAPQERARVADRLHDLTGLPTDLVLSHDLRLDASVVMSTMLADRRQTIGLYDSRFTLAAEPSGGDPVADDPAMAQYVPGYMAALNGYLRDELKVDPAETYRGIDWADVNRQWDYGNGPGRPPTREFATDLGVAMRRNPALRLFVGCGYYDLATPLGAARYVVDHAGIDRSRVSFHYYNSGHMAYVGEANRQKMADDIRAFVVR